MKSQSYSTPEPRPGRHRDAAVLADAVELVAVAALVHGRNGIGRVGTDQRHLVVVAVAHGGHAMAMRGTAGVDLDVDAKGLGEVRDLHRTGDAHVVLRIRAQKVGAALNQEVGLGLHARARARSAGSAS